MSGLESIPAPEVLNQDRVSRDDQEDMTAEDHRSQARLLATALDETCTYATQLWNDLAAMREYLHDSLPPEPGVDGAATGASPIGPSDDLGWQNWTDAFAKITSDLCGPHGDAGFGRSSAMLLAQSRRQVTVPTIRDEDVASSSLPQPDQADRDMDRSHDDAGGADEAGLSRLAAPFAYGGVGAIIAAFALRRRAFAEGPGAGSRKARRT